MVWIDGPSYYDPPGGVLTFTPDVPDALVFPKGGMNTSGHIALINHQLRQIRSGLALAISLGRLLVLPEVTCGYDKAWYALSSGQAKGAFGGAHSFILPIRKCPLDHFLEVGPLHPLETLREYSFLSNPRTPEAVKKSVATATVDLAQASAEVERLATDFRGTKVLQIDNLAKIDATKLLTTTQRLSFRKRFLFASGSWCCAPNDDVKVGLPKSYRFSLMNA